MTLTLVTGASDNHFTPLVDLLGSVYKHAPEKKVIFYDLGLTDGQRDVLKILPIDYRVFPFDKYPAYVSVLRNFAWKPIIIEEVLAEGSPILWMDAGNLIGRSLSEIEELIERDGVYSPPLKREFNIEDLTHPDTLTKLNADESVRKKKFRHAAALGLHPRMHNLAKRWRDVALTKEIISPDGATNRDHHFDQSVLSILLYQLEKETGLQLQDKWLGMSACNDTALKLTLEQLLGGPDKVAGIWIRPDPQFLP